MLAPVSTGTRDRSNPIALDATEALDSLAGARPAIPELRPGEQIGRYLIEQQLGAGGMGVVFSAHDPQLDRKVAIKLLHAGPSAPDLAARLAREAIALAKLAHPNVVAVHDFGEVEGRVFVAMQYIDGTTLGPAVAAKKGDWRGIVSLFVPAGRGLAAAHEAGLVHRDIKPGNILVDSHGGVHVTDFGLARLADDTPSGEASIDALAVTTLSAESHHPTGVGASHTTGRSILTTPMTEAGVAIGTPAYMAPEQFLGRKITARTDQFSFCVALWEALHGQHPFLIPKPGETAAAARIRLADGVIAGDVVPPPASAKVPRWLTRAVRRGLEPDPAKRWPDMGALLAAITPRVHRSPAVIAAVALAAAAGGAAIVALAVRGGGAPSCASLAEERIDAVWSPERRAAIASRFAAAGRPYAAAMAESAGDALDAYATEWAAARTDACAATRERGEQTELLAERRLRCLDERHTALGVVVGLLADEDRPEFTDQALRMVSGLPALADCADAEGLLAGVAPPAPEIAAKVAALEPKLAEARARRDAGQFREAKALAEAMRADADAAGYAPIQVGVDHVAGECSLALSEPGAFALFSAALERATRHRLDRDAARTASLALVAAAQEKKPEAADAMVPVARGLAERVGDPAFPLEFRIRYGRALVRMRRWKEAAPVCREAIAASEALYGADNPKVVLALDCLMEALIPLDVADEALPVIERALALRRAQVGEDHPAIADYLEALSNVYDVLGNPKDQRGMLEKALAIRERAFGPEHAKVAESLMSLAHLDAAGGNLEAARATGLRALNIAERASGPDSRQAAFIHNTLGTFAVYLRDLTEGRKHLDRARDIFTKEVGERSLEVAMVLIFYGQMESREGDVAGGIAMLERALAIMEEHKDHRATIARSALGSALIVGQQWDRAVVVLEHSLAADQTNIAPQNRILMRLQMVKALQATGGDKARIRTLIDEARDIVTAGNGALDDFIWQIDQTEGKKPAKSGKK